MKKLLTSKGVEATKPDPSRRLEIADAGCPGLYLVVQPSGAKSWAMRYRVNGRPQKLTLGNVNNEAAVPTTGKRQGLGGLLTLSEARILGAEQRHLLAQGIDPAPIKVAFVKGKAEAQLASDRSLVKNVVKDFLKRHVQAKGLRSADQVERTFERFVTPKWGERDVATVTKRDVIELIEGVVDQGTPILANRLLSAVRKFFNWCEGRDIIGVSPANGIAKPGEETSRTRVLSDEELKLFWHACEKVGQPFGKMAQFLLLTAQRCGEASHATYDLIDLKGKIWTIPAEQAKNGKEQFVPLSDAAITLLQSVKRVKGKPGFVFTTNGETPVSGFSKAKTNIDDQIVKLQPKESETIPHWTFHDLRRTAATGMARMGVAVHVVEAVLNHNSGSISGVAKVYNRFDYAEEKRKALDAWASHVCGIVTEIDLPANLVFLRRLE